MNKHQWFVKFFPSSVEIFSLCKCSVISSPVVPLPDSLKCWEFSEMANEEILILNLSLDDHWSYWYFGLSEVHALPLCVAAGMKCPLILGLLVHTKCVRCPQALQQSILSTFFGIILVRVKCRCCPWVLQRNLVSTIFGIIIQLSSILLGTLLFPQKGLS